MLQDMDFYHLQEIYLTYIKKQLLDTGLDSSKTACKEVVHKPGEFLGNKVADSVTNSYNNKIVKRKPVQEMIILPEKREEILNELRQVL